MTDPPDRPDLTGAVARTLQALRADRAWSLDQLAARSGVSKGVLVALEQGRSNPNLATLARISDAFGVPVTRLVDVTGEPVLQISSPGAPPTRPGRPNSGAGSCTPARPSAARPMPPPPASWCGSNPAPSP